MRILGYDITLEVDGIETVVQLDDTYPSIDDWKSASEFAVRLAQHEHPEAISIDFVSCAEFEMEEYEEYGFIHEAPYKLQ